jgi:eukaryotic-like serine/threonine-protein kinase
VDQLLWKRIGELFGTARLLNGDSRIEFLKQNCGNDRDLFEQVMSLLDADDKSGPLDSAPTSSALPVSQVIAARFRIVRFIAEGGMGTVYEAEDLRLNSRVALKTISPRIALDPRAVERFKREILLGQRVTHPNVCRIHDLGVDRSETGTEFLFLTMQFLDGETLASRIKRGPISKTEAFPLIEDMADALSAAHHAEVIHRDFKSGNVMLVNEANRDRAVVTDFGLARGLRESRSLTGAGIVGTADYMAPEQVKGEEITPATDIYAMGVVMYEMATGQRPFTGDSDIAVAQRHVNDEPQPPRDLVPNLDPNWAATIIRCLRKHPQDRFQTAAEVKNALVTTALPKATAGRIAKVRKIVIQVLLVAGFVLGGLYYPLHQLGKGHATLVHAAVRPTIAVLGFKNLSGKTDLAWISPALSQMLSTELSAGEKLHIIPSEQVTHGKIDLALTDENSLGRDSLARLRNNIGSDFVVLGSFVDIGGQIRIDLSLQNAVAGETIANISESGPEQSLPELATRAGERLRHKLGVADPSAEDAARTQASQSSSLAATKLYSEGLEKLHSFDSLAARDLLEQAIVKDPNYALAHAALAEAWRSLRYAERSASEAKKAMDSSVGLPRKDQLAIEAQYRNSTHEIARESEIYKTLFNFYPDSLEYGFSLAKSQYSNAQFQEANTTLDSLQQLPPPQGDDPRIDFARSAVAVSTGDYKAALALAERVELRARQRGARRMVAEALATQCQLQSRLGEVIKARAACDKSRTVFSDIGDLAGEAAVWGQIAFQAGDAKGGRMANERQIALLKKVESAGGLAWAMTVAGELSADLGDYPRALREYNEALKLYEKINDQSGVNSTYGNLGWVNSLQGNLTNAASDLEQAITLMRRTNSKGEMDLWLELLAEVLLSEGDVPGATKQLEEGFTVNTGTGDKRVEIYLHTARSRLLLAERELNESRREAELAIRSCLEVHDQDGANAGRLLLARLDIAENHSQTAAEALRKLLSAQDQESSIEARALLIEALLIMPSDESKREVGPLAKIAPHTQNASLRMGANLQIARARFVLGERAGAVELLDEVISESGRLGYKGIWLEARLAQAEIEVQSGVSSAGRVQIEKISKQAEAMGLKLIANKTQLSLK